VQVQASGVSFTLDADVKMSEVLQLCLAIKQEDLAGICNTAGKELAIETKLHVIATTWSDEMLEYTMHEATGMPLLVTLKTADIVQDLQEEQVRTRLCFVCVNIL
jgi:hypothetical protein